MKPLVVDINADVGEGLNNEHQLMPLISSCNIACGAHAGNKAVMMQTAALAKQHNVKIGAHPSYPDKENFGRKLMNISKQELYNSLMHQIDMLNKIVCYEGLTLHHIKPHGALYNQAAKNKAIASIVIKAIKQLNTSVKLYAPYNSVISKLAQQENINVVYEGFLDRRYNTNLQLVSREHKHAIIYNFDDVLNQFKTMYFKSKVTSIEQKEMPIQANTFCIHGDNPEAILILKQLHTHLKSLNIKLA